MAFSTLVDIKQEQNALQSISSVSAWWDLGTALRAFIGIYTIEIIGMQHLFLSLFIITTILFINYYIKNAKSSYTTI